MVTFIYCFFMMLILGLIIIIDLFVYRTTFMIEFIHLYKTSVGSGKWMLMLMWLSGLFMSILADARLKKKKAASGSQ